MAPFHVLSRACWAFAVLAAVAVGCGGSTDDTEEPPARMPAPAPRVELTAEERDVWAPLPPDRSAVPVLLYHGVARADEFANAADAEYGLDPEAFARQMTLLDHAGYETMTLDQFVRFVRGEEVDLPPRPLLLTFDDARADSWTGGDGVLRELGFNAVMFVDVGRVEGGDPEYLTWDELAALHESGRWEPQLHSGEGHQQIRIGPGEDDYGPYYANRRFEDDALESFEDWRERSFNDITWGHETLAEHVPDFRPLAFAPPFGNYGQDGTNDERIPDELVSFLLDRYSLVFTQDRTIFATPGEERVFGRLELTRAMTAGDLRAQLVPGG